MARWCSQLASHTITNCMSSIGFTHCDQYLLHKLQEGLFALKSTVVIKAFISSQQFV